MRFVSPTAPSLQKKNKLHHLPLTALIGFVFANSSVFAQNAVTLEGPVTSFAGQKNGGNIQGQTTVTNATVQGQDSKLIVTTSANANLLNGFSVKSFQSDASALGGMQVNNGQVNATAEFLKSSNVAGYSTKIDRLESNNQAAGNVAGFGAAQSQNSAGTFSVQGQINAGSITANTVANLDVNTNSAERSAVLNTAATGNSLGTFNAFSVNGARQINAAGAAVNATTTVNQMSAGNNSGSFTKLNVNTQAIANSVHNSNVNVVINHNGLDANGTPVGVQNNSANVNASSNINTNSDPATFTTMLVRGSQETIVTTSGTGNSLVNNAVQTWNNNGSTSVGMQSNSGNINATTRIANFDGGTTTTRFTTVATGNDVTNVNTVNFQQGGMGLALNGTILQENKGNIKATTELINTNFGGDTTIRTQATGNNAISLWDAGKSLNQFSMGSQINSGDVAAITTWTIDPSKTVNMTTTATGNSMVLAPTPTK